AGVLFLPWVPTLLRQFLRVTEGGGWTVWPLTPYQIVRRFVQLAVTVSPFNALGELAYQYGPRVGALVLCALAILIGARAVSVVRKRQADLGGLAIADAGGRIGLGLPVVYLAVPFALAYLTHALFGVLIGFPYFAFAATAVWVIVLIALDPAYLPRMSRSVVVAATVASQLALYPHAVAEHREDIREAVADFDAHARPGAKALTVASFVRDGFLVYSGRSEAAVGLPADLPGRETVGRERAGRLAEPDRAAFVDAVADAPEVWLVLSHEMRGEIDRGEGLSRQWLSELGYREMEIQRAAGVRWGRWMKTNKPSETEAAE
ncbi:hypothetical protein KDL45_13215, partial [bacterium]|nr:hypothetical protein [bacterium]